MTETISQLPPFEGENARPIRGGCHPTGGGGDYGGWTISGATIEGRANAEQISESGKVIGVKITSVGGN